MINWIIESLRVEHPSHNDYVFDLGSRPRIVVEACGKPETVEEINKFIDSRGIDFINRMQGAFRHEIKRVIFNPPATVILWQDGTKTVVKCQPGDTYDSEKGFALAYLKKLLGNDNTFNKEIHKWVPAPPAPAPDIEKPVFEKHKNASYYVKCVALKNPHDEEFSLGKIYPVYDDSIYGDSGYCFNAWARCDGVIDNSFERLSDWFADFLIFELVNEEPPPIKTVELCEKCVFGIQNDCIKTNCSQCALSEEYDVLGCCPCNRINLGEKCPYFHPVKED